MKNQRGAALMIILMIAGVLGAFFAIRAFNGSTIARDQVTAAALAQAKEALIGYATNYRYLVSATEVFGYLPCPDTNNDDVSESNCSTTDVSVLGRLPWKTQSIGLPPLRDSASECLWYAVSGVAKDNPKTAAMNWDTAGQFIIQDTTGTVLTGLTPHDRAFAVILAPQASLVAHTAGLTSECGGTNPITASTNTYLEGTNVLPGAGIVSTITVSTLASKQAGTNNDLGIWITNKNIFDRVKVRNDFKNDIDTMLNDLAVCLNNLATGLPSASLGNKGIDNIITACPGSGQLKTNVLAHWKDNLLYTKPASASTVNGVAGCNAILFFGGERTSNQSRDTAAAKLLTSNYLEGTNATIFPSSGAYTGATGFSGAASSTDNVRCIVGLSAGGTQQSFTNPSDFASLIPIGVGVTTNTIDKSVTIADATGSSGACLWSPTLIPLAGKTLRAYYDFKFSFADANALTGTGSDRGNGFTITFVEGDIPKSLTDPTKIPPDTCGTESAMGVLGAADAWGLNSIFIETDVNYNSINSDPAENHTAIMLNGNLGHTGTGDTMSTACNGTTAGCRHSPANKFEESPLTQHNQRIEIHTGCNATCALCDPADHVAPNTYARITAWVDCTDCNDVVTDINRATKAPTIQRCMLLSPTMNSIFFGFTSGFRTGGRQQGVTLTNAILRSE